MERAYEEAFTEVEEILKIMPIDLVSKIPVQFRQAISENKATDYKVTIKEPLEEQKLKKETIIILGLIYRDYLASPEEREKLQIKDAKKLQENEQKMKEQYDIENIFKNKRKSKKLENEMDSKELILYKEPNFIRKLLNIIKGIFKKNKF